MAYRGNDPEWANVVNWTRELLIAAEELGIHAADAFPPKPLGSAAVNRLLGRTQEVGKPLHLREDWAAQVLNAVGNYGEIYARTLGPQTKMAMSRGNNALAQDGGTLTARPLW